MNPTTKTKWHAPSLDYVLATLLLVPILLLLSDHFDWFAFNRHKGWTVLIAATVVAAGFSLIAVWFVVDWIVSLWTRRGSFQFSLRSALLAISVVAIVCGWFGSAWNDAKRQDEVAARLYGGNIGTAGSHSQNPHTPPVALVGSFPRHFFQDLKFASARHDADLDELGRFPSLESLLLMDRGVPSDGTNVSDRGLIQLRKFTKLRHLHINSPHITNAGLAHLQGNRQLEALGLLRTRVDDAGLEVLKDFPDLEQLSIGEVDLQHYHGWASYHPVRFVDAEVERLKFHSRLAERGVAVTNADFVDTDGPNVAEWGLKNVTPQSITDAGLVHLAGLTRLGSADFNGLPIDGSGLQHLEGSRKHLSYLRLNRCPITDQGLANVRDCPVLIGLELRDTLVTDAGLENLRTLPLVRTLILDGTRVDGSFCQHLVQPSPLEVLSLNGTRINDDSLAYVGKSKSLHQLYLRDTSITDAGLIHLQDFQELGCLDLSATQVRGAGLAHLKSCQRLGTLDLSDLALDDKAYEHLPELKNVSVLYLNSTPTTDAHLASLVKFPNLRRLHLIGTPVTDAGLVHLWGMKTLDKVNISGTQVTPAGEKSLQKALPRCKIEY